MKTALQLYSLRDALDADLDATLARVREIGYTAVEPYGLMARADVLVRALPEHDLTAPSTHEHFVDLDDPSAVFATAARLGIGTVIDPMIGTERWQRPDDIAATAARLNEAAALAATHGVRVGYHNHGHEAVPRFEGRTALELLADDLAPEVVLEVDTYWAATAGVDVPKLLGALGDRVRLVHLKDGDLSDDNLAQQPLGQGRVDVGAIMAAATAAEWGVVEFDDYAGDIFAGVEASLRYLEGGR